MSNSQNTLAIDPGEGEGSHEAFVFLRLYDGDEGRAYDRAGKTEFINRNPKCICIKDGTLYVELVNIGNMASDLITLDYQLIYCTLAAHGIGDAFSVSHAQEVQSTKLERIASASFVEAKGTEFVKIVLPPPPAGLANIYFRARASTLWDAPDFNTWDFKTDVKVTEFYLKVPR